MLQDYREMLDQPEHQDSLVAQDIPEYKVQLVSLGRLVLQALPVLLVHEEQQDYRVCQE